MKNFNRAVFVCVMTLFLLGNSNADPVEPTSKELLYASDWTLVILNGTGLEMAKFPEQKPYIKFNLEGRFSAKAGCNQIAGGFSLEEPDIMIFAPNMVSTKMACAEYFMQLENQLMNTLPKVKYWKIDNGKSLNLLNADKFTVAIFTNVSLS